MVEVTSTLEIEAVGSYEMLETAYQCTWYHNPEDQNLNINVVCIIGFQNMT
jgi:hypothetical protein